MKLVVNKFTYKKIAYLFFRTVKNLKRINKYYVFFTMLITMLLSLSPTLNIIALKELTNAIQVYPDTRFPMYMYIIFFFMISLVTLLLTKYNEYMTFCFSNRISYHINIQILNKTKSMSLSDFENPDIYNKIQRAEAQSDEVLFNYFLNFLSLIGSAITILSSLALIIFWRWWFVILILLVSFFRSIVMIKYGRQKFTIHTSRTSNERRKWYYSYLLKNDLSFKEIKIYQLHKSFLNKYKKIFNDFFIQDREIQIKMDIVDFFLSLVGAIIQILLIFFGTYDAALKRILIGDAISFIQGGNNIRNGSDGFMTTLATIVTSSLYLEQLFDFLDLETEIPNKRGVELSEPIKKIEFKNVSYKYKSSNEFTLKNINMTLDSNCRYYLVGRNGSGKSTLAKILLNLYDDYEGTIEINGVNLKTIAFSSYWEKIGILFQDYTKYELTLRENITFSEKPSKSKDSKLIKTLRQLDNDFLITLPLNQQLGFWFDNGVQLSGGQWIKIAISRALQRNPSLLILDEPNASLDNISEKKLLNLIQNATEDKISLIITHRLKNIDPLNSVILFMEDGKICDQGNTVDLLNKNKSFAELYNAEK